MISASVTPLTNPMQSRVNSVSDEAFSKPVAPRFYDRSAELLSKARAQVQGQCRLDADWMSSMDWPLRFLSCKLYLGARLVHKRRACYLC